MTNTLNVLIFHKTTARCSGWCSYSGFSPFACLAPCPLLFSVLPVVHEDSPAGCSKSLLCPLPIALAMAEAAHLTAGPPQSFTLSFQFSHQARPFLQRQKSVSFALLRNLELNLNRWLIYFTTMTHSYHWMGQQGGWKNCARRGMAFCKETEEISLRKLRSLLCQKGRQGSWWHC